MFRDIPPEPYQVDAQYTLINAVAGALADPDLRPPYTTAELRAEIFAALGRIWEALTPEAVRNALISSAAGAAARGWSHDIDQNAGALLGFAPADGDLGAGFALIPATPLGLFASSLAFDRTSDDETRAALASLLALARRSP